MSFELETENIIIYKPLKAANVKAVVDTDIIVPDTKPDVLNILQVNALSSIQEKQIHKDKILVSGTIDYTVLYSGGDENIEVKSINYKAPFNQQIEADGIEEGIFNYVISSVSHIEFKIQNSRKINIKSVVSFDTGIVGKTTASSVCSIITDVKIPVKRENIKALNMAVCSENSFFVSDELKFPGIPGEINEILKTDIKLSSREIKTMNNKIVIKGSVITDTLYSVEGDMYHMENETPFTEVIEAEGLSPEMHTEIKYNVRSADFELCSGDSEYYVSFNGNIDVLIKAYEENTYEIITDAYCPDYEVEIKKASHTVRSVKDTMTDTYTLSELVSLSESMPGIVKVYNLIVNPVIEDTTTQNGYAQIEGYLDTRLLYLSDSKNLPVYSVMRKIPFSMRLDNKEITNNSIFDTDVTLEHSSYILKSERDAEIRAALKVFGKVITQKNVEVISDITVNEEAPLKKQEQPGIVIYFADENEDLWEIAKRYNTTSEEIAEVNNIELNIPLKKRQQLLIPKRLIV